MRIIKRNSYEQGTNDVDISVFIDVFRASTSLVYLFHQGAREVILPQKDTLIPSLLESGYLLVSEVFSEGLDNSPSQILNTNLTNKKVVLRTTNFTTAIVNNINFKHALAASFANIEATARYIQRLNPSTIEIVMASQFEKRQVAIEDVSCADMLNGLLTGKFYSDIPNQTHIRSNIEELKKAGSKFLDHYWLDLDIALTLNTVSIVPGIRQETKEIVRFTPI